MAYCTSCGDRIIFAKTESGKSMPLDPDPNVTMGNVRVTNGGPGGKLTCRVLSNDLADKARRAGELLYLAHFVNCPNARHHRRTRGARRG